MSDTKFTLKIVYFVGFRGFTASSYMVCEYTTSGHMELERGRVCVCVCKYTLYVQYMHTYIRCINLFIIQ